MLRKQKHKDPENTLIDLNVGFKQIQTWAGTSEQCITCDFSIGQHDVTQPQGGREMEMRAHHHRARTAPSTASRLFPPRCNCVLWKIAEILLRI